MKKLLKITNLQKAVVRPLFACQYLKGKMKAKLGYKLGNGYSLLPGRVFFVLTGRCNLKCNMCPQVNHPTFRKDANGARDLDIQVLRKIVDDISSFRPMVMISGGELFMHPSWHDFLSYIKKKSLYCSIGSNGTFLKKYASQLIDLGLDEISISIDGLEQQHDKIRGLPGVYEKAIKGIEEVTKEKKRRNAYKPLINVLFTITSLNYKEIQNMVDSMTSLEIETLRIGHLNYLRQNDFDEHMDLYENLFGIDHDTSWAGLVNENHNIEPQLLANAVENIKNNENGKLKITFFPDFSKEEIVQYYSGGPFRSKSFKNACLFPWDMGLIGPMGEIILCPNYIIGNLQKHSFREIWNNDRAKTFRKIIMEKKELPACSRGCCFFYT